MLLALDVGNTHVVVGLMEGREVRRSFRIATRRDNAVGDYAVALSQLLELAEVNRQEVEQVIISSVVPPVTRALQGAARLLTGKEPLVVGGNVRCRVPVRIKRPETLGADLLTAAVNRAILTGFSTLYQELVEKEHLVPVTDPDFELLAVNRAEGFRAGAEFYCLPPLKLERYTGFTQPIQPRPIRQVSIELEVNTRHGDEDRAADAAGKAALRQQVARELYTQRCAQAKALARRELIFQLGGCVKGTLPKDLVSGNYFAEQRNFNLRLQANNVNFDQYLKVRGQTVEQFRTELHAQAEQKLRGNLGLLMVAEREHLWPTDAEVEAALAHWKGERTFPANDFRKVRQGIASQRAAEFVEAHSTLLPPPEEPVLETIA